MMPTESDLREALHRLADSAPEANAQRLIEEAGRRPAARRPATRSWVTALAAAAVVVALAATPAVLLRHRDAPAAVSPTSAGSASGLPSISTTPTGIAPTHPTAPSPTGAVAVPTTAAAARALFASGRAEDPASYQQGSWTPTGAVQHIPDVVQFSTPSRNIRCVFGSSSAPAVFCSVESYAFPKPSRPAGCALNFSPSLLDLTPSDGAALGQCVGNEQVTYQSSVLAYGHTLSSGGAHCYSGSAALTCYLDGGHGFSVSRQALHRF